MIRRKWLSAVLLGAVAVVTGGLVYGGVQRATVHTGPLTGQRLDAVFVDPRITVTGYRVVDSPAARRASDHLPVVVDLALPA